MASRWADRWLIKGDWRSDGRARQMENNEGYPPKSLELHPHLLNPPYRRCKETHQQLKGNMRAKRRKTRERRRSNEALLSTVMFD